MGTETKQAHPHGCLKRGGPRQFWGTPASLCPQPLGPFLGGGDSLQGLLNRITMSFFSFLGYSVESSDVNWKKKKSGGIKIVCQSEMRDFSAMAFITDHVNSLIDQWFPGKNILKQILWSYLDFFGNQGGVISLGTQKSHPNSV